MYSLTLVYIPGAFEPAQFNPRLTIPIIKTLGLLEPKTLQSGPPESPRQESCPPKTVSSKDSSFRILKPLPFLTTLTF